MVRASSNDMSNTKRKVSANRKRFPNYQSITSSIQNLLSLPASKQVTAHKNSHSKVLTNDLIENGNEWAVQIPKSAHQQTKPKQQKVMMLAGKKKTKKTLNTDQSVKSILSKVYNLRCSF